MTSGFWHESIGYWETTTEPTEAILEKYPTGFTRVPPRPSLRHRYDGTSWVLQPITKSALFLERDRRLGLQLIVPLGDGIQAFTFGNSLTEKEFLRSTIMLVNIQGTTEDVMLTDATGYVHMLTPPQLLRIFTEVTLYETEVMNSAMFMADAPDIPEDYAADERWPSTTRN